MLFIYSSLSAIFFGRFRPASPAGVNGRRPNPVQPRNPRLALYGLNIIDSIYMAFYKNKIMIPVDLLILFGMD
jgi:hypothetical protein